MHQSSSWQSFDSTVISTSRQSRQWTAYIRNSFPADTASSTITRTSTRAKRRSMTIDSTTELPRTSSTSTVTASSGGGRLRPSIGCPSERIEAQHPDVLLYFGEIFEVAFREHCTKPTPLLGIVVRRSWRSEMT